MTSRRHIFKLLAGAVIAPQVVAKPNPEYVCAGIDLAYGKDAVRFAMATFDNASEKWQFTPWPPVLEPMKQYGFIDNWHFENGEWKKIPKLYKPAT